MYRIRLVFLMFPWLLGCQGGYFPLAGNGPTQIPPPPTGAANAGDPYYRPNGNVGLSDPNRNATFTAERQSRFTSDGSSSIVQDTNEANYRGADYQDRQPETTYRENLEWREPNVNPVIPAGATESGRPRPQFSGNRNFSDARNLNVNRVAQANYSPRLAVPTLTSRIQSQPTYYMAPSPEVSFAQQRYQEIAADARYTGWAPRRTSSNRY